MGTIGNIPWAVGKLREYVTAADEVAAEVAGIQRAAVRSLPSGVFARPPADYQAFMQLTPEMREQVLAAEQVAERIIREVDAELVEELRTSWDFRARGDVARRAIATLETQREVAENLGPAGPVLQARSLHPKVWQVASAYWDSGLYDDAIEAAAKVVRTEARAKLGKPDLDESAVGDAFSKDDPKPDMPRLRFSHVDPEDKKTWEAVHMGALHYAKGCFMALRNPRAHLLMASDEDVALEQLAAFSVLARWIDECEVVEAD